MYNYVNTFHTIDSVVASMCYQTSVTSNRVVLDGFLTYQSSTTACSCTLMSSKSTTVRFVALNNLHPNHVNCGNVIRVQSGGTTIIVSCYVSGDVQVSPSQTATHWVLINLPFTMILVIVCYLTQVSKQK